MTAACCSPILGAAGSAGGATHAVHMAARDFDERLALLRDPPVIHDWEDEDEEDDAYGGEYAYEDEADAEDDGGDDPAG